MLSPSSLAGVEDVREGRNHANLGSAALVLDHVKPGQLRHLRDPPRLRQHLFFYSVGGKRRQPQPGYGHYEYRVRGGEKKGGAWKGGDGEG